jgi:hypothetical protein
VREGRGYPILNIDSTGDTTADPLISQYQGKIDLKDGRPEKLIMQVMTSSNAAAEGCRMPTRLKKKLLLAAELWEKP